jgi:hypothetical protein
MPTCQSIHYSFLVGGCGLRPLRLPANGSGGDGHVQFRLGQTPSERSTENGGKPTFVFLEPSFDDIPVAFDWKRF